MVIWLIGLSCAGKTTVGKKIREILKRYFSFQTTQFSP